MSHSEKPVPASETLTPALFIDEPEQFDEMIQILSSARLLAIDTESDSLFRYTPRVCLIQISMPIDKPGSENGDEIIQTRDYLLDPLALGDISSLGKFCADPDVEIILHAAENDILIMQRDFDFTFNNVFDTQLAARIMGRRGVGLAAMLAEEFGVKSDKRMQRTNWGQRPLTAQQKHYAQLDTCYLPTLRRRQIERLKAEERWEEAREAFSMLETIEYVESSRDSTIWDYKRTREVDLEDVGLLEVLWQWREEEARRRERPPFKVMSDSVLVELTRRKPEKRGELRQIQGLSDRQVKRYGDELLRIVARGRNRPRPPFPPPSDEEPFSPEERDRYDRLRRWRSDRAKKRGVDPDIVLSNDLIQQIVLLDPDTLDDLASIPLIGPWKRATYGPEILKLLGKS